jgi:hypothetical protein
VAAAGTAEEDRPLVADQRAAAVGQDRWALSETCPVLLAPAGRGASDEASVRSDAAKDLGAAATSGIAKRLAGENPIQGRGKDGEVSENTLRIGAVRVFAGKGKISPNLAMIRRRRTPWIKKSSTCTTNTPEE